MLSEAARVRSAEEVIEEEERLLQSCYPHRLGIVAKKAGGCYLTDSEGKTYLDCFAGISVNNVGHCHPKVVEAIQKQASELLHVSGYFHTESMALLLERIEKVMPDGMNRSFLCNSGAEAVEGAVKLAKKYARAKGRGGMQTIAFEGSFHGRLGLSLTLTGQSKYKQDLGNYANFPGVVHVPFPYTYRSKLDPELLVEECIRALEKEISFGTSEEVACLIGEPIQGEAGLVVPPDNFYPQVERLLRKELGIPFIADEVQTGFGRTGKMFAFELWDLRPDIVTLAKGLGGGMPMGAFVTSDEFSGVWKPSDHFSTFGGNPVCCAAASAAIEVIDKQKLAKNAEEVGRHIIETLKPLEKSSQAVGEVRGKGLMIGVELVHDKRTKVPDSALAGRVKEEMLGQGVIIGTGGLYGNVLRIQPPLILDYKQADVLVQTLTDILKK